ncbi:iron complex transport system permease protein [Herbihabitans rhizosphaerae]|uniref:Iron complex transport system permease protein n=1 Tax=Herbihabitans rhizosphaerae TaxID=1872711 RepID=A0A4V2ES74_9PSEU|nr:iron chelate uptake ABC transporter family permease subunit [Herbihabitans rhizosphaerae]RZS36583.1 iron complex transport system permease protein [Herbihabitans rhizosphaerae]
MKALRARPVAVGALLAVVIVCVGVYALTSGEVRLSVPDVLDSLLGNGNPVSDTVVLRLRLPRVLTAILVGAALAVSGAVMQSLTRNVLGSPDFLGIVYGATTGALITIIWIGGTLAEISFGAFVGGMATAMLMYVLLYRRGLHGFRLVLVGVGLSAMLVAFNQYLITRAVLYEALAAQAWMTGSLNLRGWNDVLAMGVVLAVLLPAALLGARALGALELGEEMAAGLGVPVRAARAAFLAISVALAAVATAVTGPIVFVALIAPQVARRLTGSQGPGLLPAALLGATLLLAGDVAVQRLFPTSQLPVGIATSMVGGLYLAWLLSSEWRQRSR